MKQLRITIEGKTYLVQVEVLGEEASPAAPAAPAAVRPASVASAPVAPAAGTRAGGAAPGEVPSPLAGLVVSVDVQVGQSVSEGDKLVTLEAMKMNTQVFATCTGKVSQINVKAGDAVQEGDPLLTVG